MRDGQKNTAFQDAFFEWLPGVVAGSLPLLVFLIAGDSLIHTLTPGDGSETLHALIEGRNEFAAHLLILAIANSSVSVVSVFTRNAQRRGVRIFTGRAPMLLTLISITTLVYAAALYMKLELGMGDNRTIGFAWAGLGVSLLASLYMEITIARLAVEPGAPTFSSPRHGQTLSPLLEQTSQR